MENIAKIEHALQSYVSIDEITIKLSNGLEKSKQSQHPKYAAIAIII